MENFKKQIAEDKDIQGITELCLKVLEKYNMDFVSINVEQEKAYFTHTIHKEPGEAKESFSVTTGYNRDITLKARNETGDYYITLEHL